MNEQIQPGAFDRFKGAKLPVKVNGEIVGKAEVSGDGEVITVELEDGSPLARYIRDMIWHDLADGITVGVAMKPAIPLPYSRESYTRRWL